MQANYPEDFYCYDDFKDIPDTVIQDLINKAIDRMKADVNLSIAIEKLANSEVIVFRQFRNDINKMALRIIVMKNHYETIIELEDTNSTPLFLTVEDARIAIDNGILKKNCLGC